MCKANIVAKNKFFPQLSLAFSTKCKDGKPTSPRCSRETEAKRHLLFVTPHIVAGSAFYENLLLSFTINLLQQPGSKALDFDDGGVCREQHVVLQRSTAEFMTIDIK